MAHNNLHTIFKKVSSFTAKIEEQNRNQNLDNDVVYICRISLSWSTLFNLLCYFLYVFPREGNCCFRAICIRETKTRRLKWTQLHFSNSLLFGFYVLVTHFLVIHVCIFYNNWISDEFDCYTWIFQNWLLSMFWNT